jgi:hypothetical protein
VAWDETRGGFAWADATTDPHLAALAAARFPAGGDYMSEINPAAEALVEDVGQRMAGGAALFIDYGFPAAEYYHPQRDRGTLMCHYRHRAHGDPFMWPGLTDITAHVDFTAMAEAGERAGLEVAGFTALAPFLIGCGILDALAATGTPESVPLHPCRGVRAEVARALRNGRIVQGAGAREVGRDRVAGLRRGRPPASLVTSTAKAAMETPIASGTLVMGALPARHARYRPHHTAVVIAPSPREREIRLSWREFDAHVNRCANALAALGVVKGDRVATVLPNSLLLLTSYWACAKLGAVVVPLSPLLTATGLAALVLDAQPRVVIGPENVARSNRRSPRRATAIRTWRSRPKTSGRSCTRRERPERRRESSTRISSARCTRCARPRGE